MNLVKDISDLSLDQANILLTSGKYLVKLYAPWCGPCRIMAPVVEEVVLPEGAEKVAVDIDKLEGFASHYGVSSIPVILFIVDGEVKDRIVGTMPKPAVEATATQVFGSQD